MSSAPPQNAWQAPSTALSLLHGSLTSMAVAIESTHGVSRQASDKLVFGHFMIGIVAGRPSAGYDLNFQLAKALGIDIFVLNTGADPYTGQQLDFAYDQTACNGMKVFIFFDFNWWNTGNPSGFTQKAGQYATRPAQLLINSMIFVLSFSGARP